MPFYGILQFTIIGIAIGTCIKYNLPPASAMIITAEMARLSMKMHAYFREKIVNGIHREGDVANFIPEWAKKMGQKLESIDKPEITIEDINTELKRFCYFFFAPTIIYRDNYVRTKRVRIGVFLQNLITIFVLILYLWAVFSALCIPIFKHTAENPGNVRQFIHSVIFSTISGIICLLVLFYGVLHSWMNMFAELIRFADR
jgi:sterol O-acyltransferase